MAENLMFELGSDLATRVLTHSKFIKAGYIVVQTIAERNALYTASQQVVVAGSPVYVASEKKTYRFDPTGKTDATRWIADTSESAASDAWKYKGSVNTSADLPAAANIGDIYTVTYADAAKTITDGKNYVKTNAGWALTAGHVPTTTAELTNEGNGKPFDLYERTIVTSTDFADKKATGLYTKSGSIYTVVPASATYNAATSYYTKKTITKDPYATQGYVSQAVASVVDAAPEAFDTLKEIADWISDDKTGAAALWTAVNNKVTKLADSAKPTAGSYTKVTVTADGLVTAGTNPTTLAGYGIADASIDTTNKKIKLGNNELTVLTEHPTVTKTTDTADSVTPKHGETITYVSEVTRDANGHVTTIKKTTATIPTCTYDAATKTLTIA